MTVARVYRITFKRRNCTVTIKQDKITHKECPVHLPSRSLPIVMGVSLMGSLRAAEDRLQWRKMVCDAAQPGSFEDG